MVRSLSRHRHPWCLERFLRRLVVRASTAQLIPQNLKPPVLMFCLHDILVLPRPITRAKSRGRAALNSKRTVCITDDQGFIQDFELGGEHGGSRMIVACEITLMHA